MLSLGRRTSLLSLGLISSFRTSSSFVLPVVTATNNSPVPTTFAARASSSTTTSTASPTSRNMSTSTDTKEEYVPPKVWTWDAENGGKFSKTNRPIAGATHTKELPIGKHPLQLYSMATPNGVKVTMMLEELVEAGVEGAEYDAWLTSIMTGDQFGSGFVEINPNSKIPALMDHSPEGGGEPIRLFESGSILLYLAEKFGKFIPTNLKDRTECMNWLFWQMGSAPYVGGGFGHFFAYAPYKMQYPIDRFTMETKRQMDVLDKHLAKSKYMVGDEYTIADMAIWSWYGQIALGIVYDKADEFLDVKSYEHVQRWAKEIGDRPAVKRGKMVNKAWGPPETQLWNRHAASDFETETQDKKPKTDE